MLITIWNDLAPGLGILWGLLDLIIDLLRLVIDFIGWLLQMVMMMAQIVLQVITDAATLPITAVEAYNNAIDSPAYEIIPLTGDTTGSAEVGASTVAVNCADPMENDWCMILFGVQVVNVSLSDTILYPIVILGIIIVTIGIFWKNLWELVSIRIK